MNLRDTYPPPLERAVLKSQTALDAHMKAFIAVSPFLCLATSSAAGADVTPRGDRPGFVHVPDDHTLLVPDWPGNNRLDSLGNVLENDAVGLLFFVPGVLETLRVNGRAEISHGRGAGRALGRRREAAALGAPGDGGGGLHALRQGADSGPPVGARRADRSPPRCPATARY